MGSHKRGTHCNSTAYEQAKPASVSLLHSGAESLSYELGWEEREHLGKDKDCGALRCSSAFYQLQKPEAIVNHKGGGLEEELILECERWDKINGKHQG